MSSPPPNGPAFRGRRPHRQDPGLPRNHAAGRQPKPIKQSCGRLISWMNGSVLSTKRTAEAWWRSSGGVVGVWWRFSASRSFDSPSFPGLDPAFAYAEQRVGAELHIRREAIQFGGRPPTNLGLQMSQLELQLATGYVEASAAADGSDSRSVESVPTDFRLRGEFREVVVDRRERGGMRPKAVELRMVSVAPGLATEYGSRKQTLAPGCDDALWVEVRRMETPESNGLCPPARLDRRCRGHGRTMPT